MEYTLLTNQFGPMNLRKDPAALGPSFAQENSGVSVAQGVITPAPQVSTATLGYNVSACGTLGTSQVINTTDNTRADYDLGMPMVIIQYNGRAIRTPRFPTGTVVTSYALVPQYFSAANYWDALGIAAPIAATTTADAAAGAGPNGTYYYYVTFGNAFGDESPPSPISASVTVADNDVSLSAIPIGYGTATLTNGLATFTASAGMAAALRVGMRITSPLAGIPAGTIVKDISGTTVTMSANFTGVTGAGEIQDAQVTKRFIYRTGGTLSSTNLVTTLSNVTATTYTDSFADSEVTANVTLGTSGYDVLEPLYCATVSPEGMLMGINSLNYSQVIYSEIALHFLSKSTYSITVGETVSHTFYSLNRFILFTYSTLYFVLGDEPSNLQLVKTTARANVRNGATYYGGANPVEMADGTVWFTALAGVCSFDGSAVTALTEEVFTDAQNESIGKYTMAAGVVAGKYIVLTSLDDRTKTRALLYEPAMRGWRWLTADDDTTNTRDYGALWVDPAGAPSVTYYYLETTEFQYFPASSPDTGGVYWTGEWSGERRSSLKKFRRVSVLHNGNVTVQPYVNGAVAGSAQALSRATFGRSVFWLPSETRGRTCSVKMTMTNAAAEVHEVGIWVGEERGPMP